MGGYGELFLEKIVCDALGIGCGVWWMNEPHDRLGAAPNDYVADDDVGSLLAVLATLHEELQKPALKGARDRCDVLEHFECFTNELPEELLEQGRYEEVAASEDSLRDWLDQVLHTKHGPARMKAFGIRGTRYTHDGHLRDGPDQQ